MTADVCGSASSRVKVAPPLKSTSTKLSTSGGCVIARPSTRVRSSSDLPDPVAPTTSPCGPIPPSAASLRSSSTGWPLPPTPIATRSRSRAAARPPADGRIQSADVRDAEQVGQPGRGGDDRLGRAGRRAGAGRRSPGMAAAATAGVTWSGRPTWVVTSRPVRSTATVSMSVAGHPQPQAAPGGRSPVPPICRTVTPSRTLRAVELPASGAGHGRRRRRAPGRGCGRRAGRPRASAHGRPANSSARAASSAGRLSATANTGGRVGDPAGSARCGAHLSQSQERSRIGTGVGGQAHADPQLGGGMPADRLQQQGGRHPPAGLQIALQPDGRRTTAATGRPGGPAPCGTPAGTGRGRPRRPGRRRRRPRSSGAASVRDSCWSPTPIRTVAKSGSVGRRSHNRLVRASEASASGAGCTQVRACRWAAAAARAC